MFIRVCRSSIPRILFIIYLQFENFESLLFMFTTLFEIFYERKLGENSIQFQNINNNIYESLFKFFLS